MLDSTGFWFPRERNARRRQARHESRQSGARRRTRDSTVIPASPSAKTRPKSPSANRQTTEASEARRSERAGEREPAKFPPTSAGTVGFEELHRPSMNLGATTRNRTAPFIILDEEHTLNSPPPGWLEEPSPDSRPIFEPSRRGSSRIPQNSAHYPNYCLREGGTPPALAPARPKKIPPPGLFL